MVLFYFSTLDHLLWSWFSPDAPKGTEWMSFRIWRKSQVQWDYNLPPLSPKYTHSCLVFPRRQKGGYRGLPGSKVFPVQTGRLFWSVSDWRTSRRRRLHLVSPKDGGQWLREVCVRTLEVPDDPEVLRDDNDPRFLSHFSKVTCKPSFIVKTILSLLVQGVGGSSLRGRGLGGRGTLSSVVLHDIPSLGLRSSVGWTSSTDLPSVNLSVDLFPSHTVRHS